MAWVAVGAAAIGAGGAYLSSKNNAKAAAAGATTKQELDPRIANMLFGESGNSGLLSQFTGYLNQPQSSALQNYGNASSSYLNGNTAGDMNTIRNSAYGLLGGNQAPTFQGAQSGISLANGTSADRAMAQALNSQQIQSAFTPNVQAATVNAPGQNNLNLTGAFNDVINGNPAENPYLTGSLKAATDLTNASFNTNQSNVTNALQRNILPGLKSNAIASGGFGGSRQGIAEGLALSDYTNQLTNANTQLGAANSANTTAQMAGAFNQGEDRSLSALLNLSGQQYGVASQNASMAQQAALSNADRTQATNQLNANLGASNNQLNAQLGTSVHQFNASQAQQNSQYNAGLAQANSQFNAGQSNNGNQLNAQMAQQAWLANQGAMLSTNQQNNAAALGGAGLLSGLQSTALAGATGQQNYSLNQAQAVNGLLSPYIGVNSSSNTTQPYYNNTAGNALGGAAGALSLYNQFGGMNSAQDLRNQSLNTGSNFTVGGGSGAGYNVSAGTAPTNSSLFNSWYS